MTAIVEREVRALESRLGLRGVERLREMILQEANTWAIEAELGVSKFTIRVLRENLPAFVRLTEVKKFPELRLVYSKTKVA